MMNSREQVNVLVKAAYPIIYIVSHEENRVKEALKQVAVDRQRQFFTWSCTQGIFEFDTRASSASGTSRGEETSDPLEALEFVAQFNSPAIFVFADLHPYINDPEVRRRLRELADTLKTEAKTLITMSSTLSLPPELEKQVTVLDWPLPREEEIGQLLDEAVEGVKPQGLKLEFSPEDREKILKSCLGLTADEIDNVLAKSLVTYKDINLDVIIEEKAQIIRKSGILEFYPVEEDFDGVGGLDNLKRWLEKRGNAFSERAREFGLPTPKGVVLLGVQGCGKSLVCKALAALWRMPLLRFDVGKIFAGIVGGTEENIRRAIQTAEAVSPVILWIDELEKGFSGIKSSNFSDGGTTARAFSTFLTWQQEKKAPVFTIATCNDIEAIPPEMLRKGRFDDIFFVDLPPEIEREAIFAIHIRKHGRDPDNFDLVALAKVSENYSGAEIMTAVGEGLFDAYDEGTEVETRHIQKAIIDTVPLSRTAKEDIDNLRKWATSRARYASNHTAEAAKRSTREIEI